MPHGVICPPDQLREIAVSTAQMMKQIVSTLVDAPEKLTVKVEQDLQATTLVLSVSESDMGKVIGKQGRTAQSLRTLLNAVTMKTGCRFALDIRPWSGAAAEDAG